MTLLNYLGYSLGVLLVCLSGSMLLEARRAKLNKYYSGRPLAFWWLVLSIGLWITGRAIYLGTSP